MGNLKHHRRSRMALLFKILAIVGTAMFAGVMLAIGVILGAYWTRLPPADFLDWFARYADLNARAIPLVVVPTVIGLAGSLGFGWRDARTRWLWIGAAVCVLAVLAITVVYYVPSNAAFQAKAVPVDQVPAKLSTWLM